MLYNPVKHVDLIFHELFCPAGAVQNEVRLPAPAHRGAVEIAFAYNRRQLLNPVKLPVPPVELNSSVPGQRVNVVVSKIPRSFAVLTEVDSVACGASRIVRVTLCLDIPVVSPVALLIGRLVLEDERNEGVKTRSHGGNLWGFCRGKYRRY